MLARDLGIAGVTPVTSEVGTRRPEARDAQVRTDGAVRTTGGTGTGLLGDGAAGSGMQGSVGAQGTGERLGGIAGTGDGEGQISGVLGGNGLGLESRLGSGIRAEVGSELGTGTGGVGSGSPANPEPIVITEAQRSLLSE